MYFCVSTLTTARCLGHTRPWHRVGPSRSWTDHISRRTCSTGYTKLQLGGWAFTDNKQFSENQANIWGVTVGLRGCCSPEPTQHLNTDGCPTGDSAVQQITNGSHFHRGEGAPRWRLDCPRKRDIKGNGMEKKNGKWKITTCPEGIEWNWKCLGMRGGKTTQQLILWWPWQAAEVGPQLLQFVLELQNFYCQQKGGKFEEERGVGFL